MELTRVKPSHLTEDELRAQDEAYLAALRPVAQPQRKPEKPKLSPEEQARLDAQHELADRWERVLEMARKGRLDALNGFVAKEANPLGPGGVDAHDPDELEDAGRDETLLVYATRKGQEDIVCWLLEDARADPTLNVQRGPSTALLNAEPDEVPQKNEDEDESRRVRFATSSVAPRPNTPSGGTGSGSATAVRRCRVRFHGKPRGDARRRRKCGGRGSRTRSRSARRRCARRSRRGQRLLL